MPSEFELIRRFFQTEPRRRDVVLGIGDDVAVMQVPAAQELVVTTDTLVSGVHFPAETSPEDLGHKALAVNLSDLAAAGAEPAWVSLALTLPEFDEAWLEGFCLGLRGLLESSGAELVGGDTTRGPLSVTIQALGLVPAGTVLRRSGAMVGDLIFVTGTLGDAALGLSILRGREAVPADQREHCLGRLYRPEPRVGAGIALRGVAHAAIDISDGFLADLGHVLEASGAGARVQLDALPVSAPVAGMLDATGDWDAVLAGGDDYELLFTAPPAARGVVDELFGRLDCDVTWVGTVEHDPEIRLFRPDGSRHVPRRTGYDHFAG